MTVEAKKSIHLISKLGCPILHASRINKHCFLMTTTASGVFMDVGVLFETNIFQSRSLLIKIYDIISYIFTCPCWASVGNGLHWRCASQSSLLYGGSRYTTELPLQSCQIQLYTFRVQVLAFFLPWFPDYKWVKHPCCRIKRGKIKG